MVMPKNQTRVKVVAAVIEKGGKVLIAQRHRNDKLGGLWEFPGGKVEPEEKPEEALRRELQEELGIRAEIGDLVCTSRYDYSHLSVELLAYRAVRISGDIVPHVHSAVRWVKPEELQNYDFPAANTAVINALIFGDSGDR
jgi:8-oxo-dGTP diphosphatase